MGRERLKLSGDMIRFLRSRYGNHDYDYRMSDTNLKSVIMNHDPKTFEELDHWARDLEIVIMDILRMQEEMKA